MDNDPRILGESTRKSIEEIWQIQHATSLSMQEAGRRMQETDRIVQETSRNMRETDRKMRETDRKMRETDRKMQETDLFIKELGRQMGEWGNKWGGFTEGMAYPSMVKVLTEQFQLSQFTSNLHSRRDGGVLEIDVLGYANGDINRACIVEVKSQLRERAIEQLLRILDKFQQFFPEHKGKTVYGVLAAVNVPDDLARQVVQEGLFLARISDDTFRINVPDGFQPKCWGQSDDPLFVREAAPVYRLSGE